MPENTFYYSQLALSIYQSCQLRFRRRYLDGLYWPRLTNEQIETGMDFHLISQRYFSCGQVDRYDGMLGEWVDALRSFRPFVADMIFLPEQELRLNDNTMRLVAKYDLVVLSPDKVIIYDWKTDQHKLGDQYCANTLQTLVYRYLLVRAGNGYLGRKIAPPDLVMIYWNPRQPATTVSLTYSEKQYRRDEERLKEIINEIENRDSNSFFATTEERVCRGCEYSPICHGASPEELDEEGLDDLSLSWDDIAEI
jgi:hypothetical protein